MRNIHLQEGQSHTQANIYGPLASSGGRHRGWGSYHLQHSLERYEACLQKLTKGIATRRCYPSTLLGNDKKMELSLLKPRMR